MAVVLLVVAPALLQTRPPLLLAEAREMVATAAEPKTAPEEARKIMTKLPLAMVQETTQTTAAAA